MSRSSGKTASVRKNALMPVMQNPTTPATKYPVANRLGTGHRKQQVLHGPGTVEIYVELELYQQETYIKCKTNYN